MQGASVATLPVQDLEILEWLRQMPLASGGDLIGACYGLNKRVFNRLQHLLEMQMVHQVPLGWNRKQVKRWRIAERGLAELGNPYPGFNSRQGLARLVARLPLVESFYPLIGSISAGGGGRLLEFVWLRRRVSFDVAARFEHGWVIVLWSGFYNTSTQIAWRLERLSAELRQAALTPGGVWPGLILRGGEGCLAAGAGPAGRAAFRVGRTDSRLLP